MHHALSVAATAAALVLATLAPQASLAQSAIID